ncbi:MAG: hemin-binding protein, partial [Akkermansiaceae bacterium]|nr:hemin-binding protein [Akkermansiaceae bacterium]
SLELNNRYSADTTPLRLNGSLNYDNLWQLGHSLGLSFQIAPEKLEDAEVFSASYTIRLPNSEGWSVLLQGTKQDSNVSTLGGSAVVGRGETVGVRAMKTLPQSEHYSQSISMGFDYKHLDEFSIGGFKPITYYPFSLLYTSTWKQDKGHTDINAGINWHFRGVGDAESDFDAKRYKADGGYIYFRGDISHTQDLNTGYQWFAKVQGQASNEPLINSEQFSAGGLGSVRGYMESEALGDDAIFGTLEFRSPSLIGKGWSEADDLRVYGFFDGGVTSIHDALPLQSAGEQLASVGIGARGRVFDHFNGSLDAAYPLFSRPSGKDTRLMYTFRLWGDF